MGLDDIDRLVARPVGGRLAQEIDNSALEIPSSGDRPRLFVPERSGPPEGQE